MIYGSLSAAGIFPAPGNLPLAVVRNRPSQRTRRSSEDEFVGTASKIAAAFLTADAERETLEYLLQGMREVLGDETPEENVVRTYLQESDRPATLRMERQMVAMDKLLECAEVNLRMLCDP